MTASKSINSGPVGLPGKLSVLLLSALLAACGGGGSGGKSGGGGSGSSSSSSSSSSGSSSSSSSGSSSTSSSGGSSSGSSSSSSSGGEPEPFTLSYPKMKTFEFNWVPVEGAEFYRLLEQLEEGQGYASLTDEPLGADSTSYSMEVFVPEKAYATYMLESCHVNDADEEVCTQSKVIGVEEGLISVTGRIESNGSNLDYFGSSVAFNGDGSLLAVGNCHDERYRVKTFSREQEWAEESSIFRIFYNQRPCVEQLAISADGNTLATSSPQDSSAATSIDSSEDAGDGDPAQPASGAAFVHVREQGRWKQQAYIKTSNSEASDQFGSSMTLSQDGNTLLVGAPGEDGGYSNFDGDITDNALESSGAVYHFVRSDGKWKKEHYIKAPQASEDARFGSSLALSADGKVLAIGAEDERANNAEGDKTGSVYILSPSGDGWQYLQTLKASNEHYFARFGESLALSANGKILAVGASYEGGIGSGVDGDQTPSDDTDQSGAVYVFVEQDGSWEQQAYIKASNPDASDHFGTNLSLSADGNTLLVGAPYEKSTAVGINGDQSDNNLNGAGAGYLFTRDDSGNWRQRAYLKPTVPEEPGNYSSSAALDPEGKTLAVGADSEAFNRKGVVYIY